MGLVSQINSDLKQALLSGDKELVSVLRGLKSVILNEEVAQGKRETGLDDQTIIGLFQKETKKRNEAIDLYEKSGDDARASQEKYEAGIISNYLPDMMNEEEVGLLVQETVEELGLQKGDMQKMGQAIGEVKNRSQGRADGALIAKLVKEKLA